jgi:hypothetical protein
LKELKRFDFYCSEQANAQAKLLEAIERVEKSDVSDELLFEADCILKRALSAQRDYKRDLKTSRPSITGVHQFIGEVGKYISETSSMLTWL